MIVGMDEEAYKNDLQPMQSHDMLDSSYLGANFGQGSPSKSQSVSTNNYLGRGSGNERREGCDTNSGGNKLNGGCLRGDTSSRKVKRQHKVCLGKNFLLIDRVLRQNHQPVGSFHFLYRRSLSVVEIQPQRQFNTNMQIDEEEVPISVDQTTTHLSHPPNGVSSPVQPCPLSLDTGLKLTSTGLDTPPIQPCSLSLDIGKKLTSTGLDSHLHLDPCSDSIVFFHVGVSKRIRAPRQNSSRPAAITDGPISRGYPHFWASRQHRYSAIKSTSTLGHALSKHKRELRIEDCYKSPCLFRWPRRHVF